ncbi:hypothetical protein TNCV_4600461 [Trichonephila clavipes]|nr:hypothetical protein TNCV_4600461 [Trichonephila clavipes]
MRDKSVEAASPHKNVMWKFGEWSAVQREKSCNHQTFMIRHPLLGGKNVTAPLRVVGRSFSKELNGNVHQ